MRSAEKGAPGAVVIGGDYQGLGIARSLGRLGYRVCVVDNEHSIARFSRHVTISRRVPDLRDEAATVATLLQLGRELDLVGWVLFPTREETVAAISRHRDALAEIFRVPTPSWDRVSIAWDKRETYRLASELGIPTPRTWYPRTVADLDAIDTSAPLAIKPAIKENFVYATKAKAWRADDRAALLGLFKRASEIVGDGEVIVQELIPGDGQRQLAYCAFFKDGTSVGSMVARRLRQHPAEFGRASTFVETIDLPALQQLSERFLRAIDYYGLVELEYKQDVRDGCYKLLDVNARTWGYHTLGARAGVDFPALLMADQLGLPAEPKRAQVGIRWIRLTTDIPTAVVEAARGRLGWRSYFRSLRRANTEAVVSRDDPLPAVAELALIPYLSLKRGF